MPRQRPQHMKNRPGKKGKTDYAPMMEKKKPMSHNPGSHKKKPTMGY